jgi:dihydrofolate synthase/folylpolyglutamate synthase
MSGNDEESPPETKRFPILRAGLYRFRYRPTAAEYDVRLNLRGRHQVVNARTAIHIAEELKLRGLNISSRAIVDGLRRVDWPGRLEMVAATAMGPPLLLDGAHNPAGARSLRAFLDEHCHVPLTLIFGVMADKEIGEIAAILFPAAQVVIATRIANERAAEADLIADCAAGASYQLIRSDSTAQALAEARRLTPSDGLICACGSLYLIGEIKQLLNVER